MLDVWTNWVILAKIVISSCRQVLDFLPKLVIRPFDDNWPCLFKWNSEKSYIRKPNYRIWNWIRFPIFSNFDLKSKTFVHTTAPSWLPSTFFCSCLNTQALHTECNENNFIDFCSIQNDNTFLELVNFICQTMETRTHTNNGRSPLKLITPFPLMYAEMI